MPRLLERTVPTITVANSRQERARLSLGTMHDALKLRFTGTLTVGVAAATILEDSPLGYLRSMDLVLGSTPLRVYDARFQNFWNRYTRHTANRITAPLGAIGASNFSAELIVDHGDPSLRADPVGRSLARAFLLDSRPLSALEEVFTFGVDADVATPGGGGTAVLSALALSLTEIQVPDVRGILSRQQMSFLDLPITATGVKDDIPTFNGLGVNYRAIVLHFTSGNADALRASSDDTICTDISLYDARGVRYYDAMPYEQIRAQNKRIGQYEAFPAGWVVLDFAPNSDLEDLLVQESQTLTLRLTIGAAPANSRVRIYPIVALLRR